MSILGLIPARAGSKRVPGKNMRLLGGKPLIAWTIEVALKAKSLNFIVVSSEDEAILRTAVKWGARALKRPAELATDTASSYSVIRHALKVYETAVRVETICLLQPTSPFRTSEDIDRCTQYFVGHERRATRPAAVVSRIHGATQPSGAIYVADVSWLRRELSQGNKAPFDDQSILGYGMPLERSLDIDTEEDFARAEEIVQEMGR